MVNVDAAALRGRLIDFLPEQTVGCEHCACRARGSGNAQNLQSLAA